MLAQRLRIECIPLSTLTIPKEYLSSSASVLYLSKNPKAGYTYTTSDWDPATEEQAATNGAWGYHASQTFAEREAWKLHGVGSDQEHPAIAPFDLITLCPPMIYRPAIHYCPGSLSQKGVAGLNTSTARVIAAVTGKDSAFAPKVATPGLPVWIDVRNVAKLIQAALALEEGKSDRVLLCAGVDYFEDGMGRLRARDIEGLGEPGQLCDISKHFGIDQSKMKDKLKCDETIAFEETIEDTYNAVEALGLL